VLLYGVRFLINYLVTAIQFGLIVYANGEFGDPNFIFIDTLPSKLKAVFQTAVMVYVMFGMFCIMFVAVAIFDISRSDMFCSKKLRRKFVFYLLLLSVIFMLLTDIFLLVFSLVYGLHQGKKAFDNSNAGNRLRLAVTIFSMFDIIHTLVGIGLVIRNQRKIAYTVSPVTNDATDEEINSNEVSQENIQGDENHQNTRE
jgi:uncharacterized membrane protein YjgN (DUF898 family)